MNKSIKIDRSKIKFGKIKIDSQMNIQYKIHKQKKFQIEVLKKMKIFNQQKIHNKKY